MAQPINSWAEFKMVLNQLTQANSKELFETIIVDTGDIAYDYCSNYVCSNNNANEIADIPYGKGYSLVAKEFDVCLRKIVQLGYGLVIISHSTDKTFKDETGIEYNKIVPTLDKRANNIIARLCDIIGYSRSVQDENGMDKTVLFMRGTSRFEAGSRFKYTPDYIEFSYNNLTKAIGEAIDKQMKEEGAELFTQNRENAHLDTSSELDYDILIGEFNSLIEELTKKVDVEKFNSYYAPRITQIIEKELGRGKKISDSTLDQVEAIAIILNNLKPLVEAA